MRIVIFCIHGAQCKAEGGGGGGGGGSNLPNAISAIHKILIQAGNGSYKQMMGSDVL